MMSSKKKGQNYNQLPFLKFNIFIICNVHSSDAKGLKKLKTSNESREFEQLKLFCGKFSYSVCMQSWICVGLNIKTGFKLDWS